MQHFYTSLFCLFVRVRKSAFKNCQASHSEHHTNMHTHTHSDRLIDWILVCHSQRLFTCEIFTVFFKVARRPFLLSLVLRRSVYFVRSSLSVSIQYLSTNFALFGFIQAFYSFIVHCCYCCFSSCFVYSCIFIAIWVLPSASWQLLCLLFSDSHSCLFIIWGTTSSFQPDSEIRSSRSNWC